MSPVTVRLQEFFFEMIIIQRKIKKMLYDMFLYLVHNEKSTYICIVILKTIFFTLKKN